MSTLTLTAAFADLSAETPPPVQGTNTPPPGYTNDYQVVQLGGWAYWTVELATGTLLIYVRHARLTNQTQVTVSSDAALGFSTTTGTYTGLALAVRVECVADRSVEVYLDDVLAETRTGSGTWSFAADLLWVLPEGCGGLVRYTYFWILYEKYGVEDLIEYHYRAADLGVTFNGVAQTVSEDADKVFQIHNARHYSGYDCPHGASYYLQGDLVTMTKRQIVDLGLALGGKARAAVVRLCCGAEVVMAATAGEQSMPAQVGQVGCWYDFYDGGSFDGWLAGCYYDYSFYGGKRHWSGTGIVNGGLLVAEPLGVTTAPAAEAQVALARRSQPLVDWTDTDTFDHVAPLLLVDPYSDRVALVDDVVRQSTDLGQTWTSGLPTGMPGGLAVWPSSSGTLLAAFLDPRDRFALATGINGTTLYALGLDGVETTIATLSETGEVGAWVDRGADGLWVVGALVDGRLREWQADAPDGAWTLTADQALGADGALLRPCYWRGRGGVVAVAGYHAASGSQVVLWRTTADATWSGPETIAAAAAAAAPYLIEHDDGRWEAGWRIGGAWLRYASGHPSGAWTEVTP